jgi:hypothetical protein
LSCGPSRAAGDIITPGLRDIHNNVSAGRRTACRLGLVRWIQAAVAPLVLALRLILVADTGLPFGMPGVGLMLDGLAVAEEFVVVVVSAFAASDVGKVFDELDAFDPFDEFEAELDFVAQTQRSAVSV